MLSKFKSITIQRETAEGTFEGTATAADLVPVKDGTYTTDYEKINRQLAIPSLTPAAPLAGPSRVSLEFSMELFGPASMTADPAWDLLLRCCGWRAYGNADTALVPWGLDGGAAGDAGRVVHLDPSSTWAAGTQLDHGTIIKGKVTTAVTMKVLGTYVPGDTKIFALWKSGTAVSAFSDTAVVDDATGTAIDITITTATLGNRVYTPIDRQSYFLHGGGAIGTIPEGEILSGATTNAKGLVLFPGGLPFGYPHDTTLATALVERSSSYGFFAPTTPWELLNRGGASNSFTPTQDPVQYDIPTLSVEFNDDGDRLRVQGCRGNAVFTFKAGRATEVKFTLQGSFVTQATAPGFLPTSDLEDNIAPRLVNGTILINNELKPLFSEWSIDGGSEIVVPPDHSSASGVGTAEYRGRAFSGSMDPQAIHQQEFGLHGRSRNATPIATTAEWGTAGSDGFHVSVPRAVITNVQPTDDAGSRRYGLPMTLHGKAAVKGDEMILATF